MIANPAIRPSYAATNEEVYHALNAKFRWAVGSYVENVRKGNPVDEKKRRAAIVETISVYQLGCSEFHGNHYAPAAKIMEWYRENSDSGWCDEKNILDYRKNILKESKEELDKDLSTWRTRTIDYLRVSLAFARLAHDREFEQAVVQKNDLFCPSRRYRERTPQDRFRSIAGLLDHMIDKNEEYNHFRIFGNFTLDDFAEFAPMGTRHHLHDSLYVKPAMEYIVEYIKDHPHLMEL